MSRGHTGQDAKFTPPARKVSGSPEVVREKLTQWLRGRFGDPDLAITALSSPGSAGVNNETLLLSIDTHAGELRGKDGLVVRLEADTTLFPGVDVRSSFLLYQALQDDTTVPTPRVFGFEDDAAVLGKQFFVMERIDGLIPADNPHYSQEGWVKDMPPASRRELWFNAIETLAALHRLPTGNLAFLKDMGIGTLDQQMRYWRDYQDHNIASAAGGGSPDPLLEKTWDWLVANRPADPPETFTWGDARVANMIFRGTQVVGVLDWDMVSLAAAEYDLSWWLLQDMSGNGGPSRLDGLLDPRETVQAWEKSAGHKVQDFEFWVMLNMFRLGAIMIRLKSFLIEAGMPPEAVKDIDRINTVQSIMQTRFGTGPGFGLGTWNDLVPALSA